MGTYYNINYFHPDQKNLKTSIDSILEAFNLSLSTYIPSSTISIFNKTPDSIQTTDTLLLNVLKASLEVAKATNGAFDPTVMPLVNLWGFGPEKRDIPDQNVLDSILLFTGYNLVEIYNEKVIKKDPGVKLDFSGIAKGYGVDIIANFLESNGITNYLIEIGGDLRANGVNSNGEFWKIGIEEPDEFAEPGKQLHTTISIDNLAMATSGNYRNYFYINGIRYGHTIDPISGYPVVHELLSVTVFHPECMIADAFATAFMVTGGKKAIEISEQIEDLQVYLIYEDEYGEQKVYNGLRSD